MLVGAARPKGTGMRWSRAQVNPMVGLRTVAGADRWAAAWPQITSDRRQTAQARAHTRRRTRQAARHPEMPALPPAPAPRPVAACLEATLPTGRHAPAPPAPAVAPARPQLVVDGRPTRRHPWKRPFRPPTPPVTPCPAKL
jgi:hypothetical protein